MHRAHKTLRQESGVTLIELLIVIAILGVLAGLATVGFGLSKQQRLATFTKEFHSDLQKARLDAMTRSSTVKTRGYGLHFPANGSYRIFEYVDVVNTGFKDFVYNGATEEVNATDKTLASVASITIGDSSTLPEDVDTVVIFDKRGFVRNKNWGMISSQLYVLSMEGVTDKRCVSLSRTRIREGRWDGSNCNEI